MNGPMVLLAIVSSVVALTGGCTSGDTNTASSRRTSVPTDDERAALRPVSMPDLSRTADPLREKIRGRYSSLTELENAAPTTGLANAYGEMGKLLMAAEYFDAAEDCFLNANALIPDDSRWTYYLAHVYRNRSELLKAADFFERTLQLRPGDAVTLLWLGEVYLAQGRPEASEPLFSKALSLEPSTAAALFGLGRAALARKEYAEAVKYLEQALALDTPASIIHYPLALAYRGLGDRAQAEVHLRQRGDARVVFPADPLMHDVEGLPVNAMAYEIRGTEALNKGELTAAAEYFRKGVELEPRNPAVRLQLADVLRRTGSPEESLIHYDAVVELDPRLSQARFGYVMALVRLGQYQGARDRLVEGMKKYPDQPGFAEALARLLAAAPDDRVRNGREAMALTQALLKQQQSTELGETLAMVLAELREYEEAAAVQRELITAAKAAGRDDLVRRMLDNLRRYERNEPCRVPWPADATP